MRFAGKKNILPNVLGLACRPLKHAAWFKDLVNLAHSAMLKSLPRDALMTQSSPVISGKHHLDTESGLRYEDHMYEFVFSYLALQKKSPLCRDLDPFGSIRSMLVASAQVATGSFYIFICYLPNDHMWVLQTCLWEAFHPHFSEVAKTPRSPTARKSSNWHWPQQPLMPSWTATVHSNHCLPTKSWSQG